MDSSPIGYIRNLVADVPALDVVLNVCLQKWGTTPPITLVFAEVGDAIAENLPSLSNETRRKVFAAIEDGMVSEDTTLRTAMGTGLVEALVAGADKNPNLWAELESLLGTATMKYAIAWRNFSG